MWGCLAVRLVWSSHVGRKSSRFFLFIKYGFTLSRAPIFYTYLPSLTTFLSLAIFAHNHLYPYLRSIRLSIVYTPSATPIFRALPFHLYAPYPTFFTSLQLGHIPHLASRFFLL